VVSLSTKAILWYKRLGYISPHKIIDSLYHGLVKGVNLPKDTKASDFPITLVEAALATSAAQPHRNLYKKMRTKKDLAS